MYKVYYCCMYLVLREGNIPHVMAVQPVLPSVYYYSRIFPFYLCFLI